MEMMSKRMGYMQVTAMAVQLEKSSLFSLIVSECGV